MPVKVRRPRCMIIGAVLNTFCPARALAGPLMKSSEAISGAYESRNSQNFQCSPGYVSNTHDRGGAHAINPQGTSSQLDEIPFVELREAADLRVQPSGVENYRHSLMRS